MNTKLSYRLLLDPVHFFALGFGAGLSPKAPGTAGSIVALPLAWALIGAPLPVRVAVVVTAIAAGIWICGESARRLGIHDHPGIVFDEIAAILALTLILPASVPLLLVAFAFFRLFDIAKPWPIRDVDHRLSGGLGIMLDDLLAAVYTAVCVEFFVYLQLFA